jgi:hypothetical protein
VTTRFSIPAATTLFAGCTMRDTWSGRDGSLSETADTKSRLKDSANLRIVTPIESAKKSPPFATGSVHIGKRPEESLIYRGVETSSLMFITISESQAGRRPIWTTASRPGTVLRIVHRLSTSQRQWSGDGATCVGAVASFAGHRRMLPMLHFAE